MHIYILLLLLLFIIIIIIIIIIYLNKTSTNAEMYERGGVPPPQSGGIQLCLQVSWMPVSPWRFEIVPNQETEGISLHHCLLEVRL